MANRSEPVKHTCPDIDRIKKNISSLIATLQSIDHEEIYNVICDLESIGVGNWCELESLRDANGALRDWGNEMVKDAEDSEKALDEANDIISELETKIDQLQDEVNDLTTQLQTA